ncbi:DNA polymerase II large subunit [archaeon]|nr:DNA polymerase II large subunit [archaeon]MBT4241260.1 DNA polymerase II large subunit [archaeon]MBT4418082.1 DNA polymerase II large subunit [archaeon]
MAFTKETEEYFDKLGDEIQRNYKAAELARAKGLDPVGKVEVPLAMTMAEKVIRLISTVYPQLDNPEVIKRLLDLEKEYGALEPQVSFKIAEEIAKEKYCKFETQLEAMDAGIRVGFAYATLGVVSSPIEGFTEIRSGKTQTGETYIKAFFSGPIRSAGTTATCLVLMIIDYIRQQFGYARYDPTEQEIKRFATELLDYHERVTNLQYCPTEEEMFFIAKNIPIQICGDPTEKREVSNYKDLPRVETNFIRGGFCLAAAEGLAQKAPKGLRLLKKTQNSGIKVHDWEWLDDYVELHEKRTTGKSSGGDSPTYIKDLVAGRPVFGHPQKGFRFRYGRSRVAGFSAVSVHPATMGISNDFIATGTQLKIEKPTKGCITTPCDDIDGPIVKFRNGSVKKITDYDEAKEIYNEVEEIIYPGDLLFPLGDVLNRNAMLVKPGYVEEWWNLELKKAKGAGLDDYYNVDLNRAIKISEELKIPLHPNFIYYWNQIDIDGFLSFIDWFNHSRVNEGKLLFPYNSSEKERFQKGKRVLELLGIPHDVSIENVVLSKYEKEALFVNLGLDKDYEGELDINFNFKEFFSKFGWKGKNTKGVDEINEADVKKEINEGEVVLKVINELSKFIIKDKAGEFIGSRMGRPEKAKLRRLIGSPNVIFPVGEEGGRLKSVNEAMSIGSVKADFPFNYCKKCDRESIYNLCEICGSECEKKNYCRMCKQEVEGKCKVHDSSERYKYGRIDMKHYYDNARGKLNYLKTDVPVLIKGPKTTSSGEHNIERLEKGMLRAKYGLCVNKDGTIRYDMTEMPLSHFKPCEIEVSVEKLKELGYYKDCFGNELVSDEQILELKPHDVLLPCNEKCGDEKADDVFVNICKFMDDLLVKVYGLEPFFNVKTRSDLIGHLCVCMAPHNCAGVISRIIGFCKVQGLMGSPYIHAAMRRDCFDYSSYIPIRDNKGWRIIKIGELVEKLKPNNKVDNYGTKEKKVDEFYTLNGKNLKEVKINNFTKHTKLPMLEIKTALGKKIQVTENHKFLVNGEMRRASNLKIGDKLPLLRNINIKSKNLNEINLLNELMDEELMIRDIKGIISLLDRDKIYQIIDKLKITKRQFRNFHVRDSYPIKFVLELDEKVKQEICKIGHISGKRDNVKHPIIINLTDELLEVIGLYVAEGYSRSIDGKKGLNQVYISSNDKKIREFIKKTIKNSFGLVPSEKKEDRVTFSSKIFYLFFTKILESGSIAKEKRIPSLFLNLKLGRLACLLRGYFEGDGSCEKKRKKVSCDSVSEGLLNDLEFCLARFNIFVKRYEYEKEPGSKLKEFYIRKKRDIPKFKITKLIIGVDFIKNFEKIGFLSDRKNNILKNYKNMKKSKMRIELDKDYVYDPIVSIGEMGEKESYCLNVDSKEHLVVSNGIVSAQCDGDEAAIMLLLDVLINFSRKFLPSHRGGTQDAPLVLNGKIYAKEVDDQILDFELVDSYPLELYEKAEQKKHSSEIEIEMVKQRIAKDEDPYVNTGFTHNSKNFNLGATCSSYKTLPTMKDKVEAQMLLCEKLRAVDQGDVARLIIDRHFMRDLKGNLRKFSQQKFRCGKCNTSFRRPPLNGKCPNCPGKIIFTISYGSIVKYLEPAIDLTKNYNVPAYIGQDLQLTKKYIESIFGKDNEKQEALGKWF